MISGLDSGNMDFKVERSAMRIASSPTLRIATGLLLAVLLSVVGYQVVRRLNSHRPEALLKRADEMSWLNSWIAAEPLYRKAEIEFEQRRQPSRALYARVSQMPAHSESSTSIPSQIALLRHDLDLPEARDPETRLRILTILGMLEANYDAAMAHQTWAEVESLAIRQHHLLLASRAVGEQGFAAFLLGDIATAKKDVLRAWTVAKIADPAAHIRYASMYGAGLLELHKYKEALGPLDEAIRVAAKTPGAAYPSIAIDAKIEALSGLGRNQEALALAAQEMHCPSRCPKLRLSPNQRVRPPVTPRVGHAPPPRASCPSLACSSSRSSCRAISTPG